jgi:DNA-binding NarL/FixJ family response regulator
VTLQKAGGTGKSVRVLVVDDYEPWRRFVSTTLQTQQGLQVIGEVSDGLEAVQKAEELQPELILLDIGLPTLNGIEAARRIRKVSPASRILFVSENRSGDIAEEALSTGASGYVVKSDAASELLPAVNAVLEGKRFVSASLSGNGLNGPRDPQTGARFHRDKVTKLIPTRNVGSARHHEVGFYSDDRHFLDDVTRFIGAALKAGNSAIVVATESHRKSLLLELQAHGLDIAAAIEEGRYIPLDAANTLSTFMVNGMPDPVRFLELLGDLIVTAREAAKGANPRVSLFGECVNLLWAQGNAEAAIHTEKLCNRLIKIHDVDILCGYSLGITGNGMDMHTFERICVEHSAVHAHR